MFLDWLKRSGRFGKQLPPARVVKQRIRRIRIPTQVIEAAIKGLPRVPRRLPARVVVDAVVISLGPVQLEFIWQAGSESASGHWHLTRAQRALNDQFARKAKFPAEMTHRIADSATRAATEAVRDPSVVGRVEAKPAIISDGAKRLRNVSMDPLQQTEPYPVPKSGAR